MAKNEDSLRDRLRRAAEQLQSQHRRLDPLLEDLGRELERGISREAQNAVFRLDGAIKAHFLLEEQIVYPAIRGLRPEHGEDLDELAEDHRGLRAGLQTVVDDVLENRLDIAAQSLEKFQLAIKDHVDREETFLDALDSDTSDPTL